MVSVGWFFGNLRKAGLRINFFVAVIRALAMCLISGMRMVQGMNFQVNKQKGF